VRRQDDDEDISEDILVCIGGDEKPSPPAAGSKS
jgi:hypothetical protein